MFKIFKKFPFFIVIDHSPINFDQSLQAVDPSLRDFDPSLRAERSNPAALKCSLGHWIASSLRFSQRRFYPSDLLLLIKQTLRLMIGVPDYQAYVKHIKTNHPDKKIMAYDEFFRERQAARYSSSTKGRCC